MGQVDWRAQVKRQVFSGAQTILQSLYHHPLSHYFKHDYQHLQREQNANSLPNDITIAKKNLCVENVTSELIELIKNKNSAKLKDADEISLDSSYLTLTESIPESVSTDAPPSIFSYSSYNSEKVPAIDCP